MLHISLRMLPPSMNHAYTNNGFGGRTLAAGGRKFKNEVKVAIARSHTLELAKFEPNKPLVVLARFYFKTITNKGWPTKAKSRYKRVDATNRVKLLEDCLAEVLGVDDSCNMAFIPDKCVGFPERTEIFIWSIEEEECPIYDAIKDV